MLHNATEQINGTKPKCWVRKEGGHEGCHRDGGHRSIPKGQWHLEERPRLATRKTAAWNLHRVKTRDNSLVRPSLSSPPLSSSVKRGRPVMFLRVRAAWSGRVKDGRIGWESGADPLRALNTDMRTWGGQTPRCRSPLHRCPIALQPSSPDLGDPVCKMGRPWLQPIVEPQVQVLARNTQ